MAIKEVTGVLKLLGNSRSHQAHRGIRGKGTIYSVIEIGDQTLKSIYCVDELDNYLHRGLEHAGEVKLEIAAWPKMKTYLFIAIVILSILDYLIILLGGEAFKYVVGFGLVLIVMLIMAWFIMLFSVPKSFNYETVSVTIDGKKYDRS